MQVFSAKIIDPTHLELSQPVEGLPGDVVQVSLAPSPQDELLAWREAGKRHLLDAYADEDAVYDDL
jgi:hypothetical protein